MAVTAVTTGVRVATVASADRKAAPVVMVAAAG